MTARGSAGELTSVRRTAPRGLSVGGLQEFDQIEDYSAEAPEASVYQRMEVQVELSVCGRTTPAFIYHQLPNAAQRAASLAFPEGDWLAGVRALHAQCPGTLQRTAPQGLAPQGLGAL
jgi:hypothetical protein